MRLLALTGATGFVGGATLDRARAAGWSVAALTRRPRPPRDGVRWVAGTLEDAAALADLAAGADAVLHVAGATTAADRAAFAVANVGGTARVIDAVRGAGVRRLVHVSSLAAREPALSDYGWSKAAGEALALAAPLATVAVRPPAVYGPGDHEMLDLFRLARLGLAVLPPGGRVSAILVDDLARLLLAAIDADVPAGTLWEADDGQDVGYTYPELATAIGVALGRPRVLALSVPAPVMRLAARADRALRGPNAKLTPDRAAYFCHPDWTVDPARRPPPAIWRASVPLADGLARTAAWYRAQGLL